tara:strand:- start:1382 stop:1882 length:501 start_codon:yes stop_codon:yes gene_type:complete
MKKVLLVTITLIITSCASPTGSNAAVDGVGFFKPMPDEKFITGSDDLTDLWMKYLDAHNTQDIEAIKSMSADSIYILSPDGSEIFTKEQQVAVLEQWFAAANPKWDAYWAMPYKSVPGGADWIIAGHNVTMTAGEEETTELHMIDGEIVDGKIARFFVYSLKPAVK